ncbi:SdiA-regulated domain-containing protein [Urechidicola vernalis]|uniref:SdiA-regulated domain-containing protein n=1 Tax=Urechidicola vernalis TaxID=3075600 RepID=A0ABU2Y700_9FLAO|nr:SdiA-regulated domain-containing protein [Urechidicola sp. P050]MDT0553472.1 SdiA-regulated domain-containing protein [Urechidicola sp. P050]
MDIKEPSGIAVYNDHLYIVCDHSGTIYKTTLSGEIKKKIKTDYLDLEGITIHPKTGNIFIVSESKRLLIELNSKGDLICKTKVKGKQKHKNGGLEGLCFDVSTGFLYAVNEKSPKKLLKLTQQGELEETFKLDVSKDVSGIGVDEKAKSLWLISDESKAIINISKRGVFLKKYLIPVEKGEGIAMYDGKFYVVSDNTQELFVLELTN